MRVAVAGAGVASAIAESVELLDIAEGRAGLLGDEGAQPDLEGAVEQGIKFAGRQSGAARWRPARSVRISGSSSRAATIAAVRPIASGKPAGSNDFFRQGSRGLKVRNIYPRAAKVANSKSRN